MIRTQIQLPDEIYKKLKRLAEAKEWPLAEVLRRGAEYMIEVYPEWRLAHKEWVPPEPRQLGTIKAKATELRSLAQRER